MSVAVYVGVRVSEYQVTLVPWVPSAVGCWGARQEGALSRGLDA